MINSLNKDSHITRGFRVSQNALPQRGSAPANKRKEYRNAPVNHSVEISVRNPAEINFCGISGSLLANTHSLKILVEKTRVFMGGKPNHKNLMNLVNEAVEKSIGLKEKIGDEAAKFLESHKIHIQEVIDKSTEIIIDENKKDPLDAKEMQKELKKTINGALDVFPTVEHPGKLYRSATLKKFLHMADDSQAVFGALFALVLTGIMRPAAIMALPSSKKNKDDKKYAAAHSIASGVIAYVISLIVSSPIAKAMKKLEKEPDKFLKTKELEYLTHTRAFNAARKYANLLPEAVLAMPRAVLTVALIPPILKYIFGWEKKKPSKKDNIKPVQNSDIKNLDKQQKAPAKEVNGGKK